MKNQWKGKECNLKVRSVGNEVPSLVGPNAIAVTRAASRNCSSNSFMNLSAAKTSQLTGLDSGSRGSVHVPLWQQFFAAKNNILLQNIVAVEVRRR